MSKAAKAALAGDKTIYNLTPQSANIGGRIVKNMRIAGSGTYMYHRREAALFGLDESFLPGDQMYFNMYRPPEVLERNKNLFARVPIITGKHVVVNQDNAKELVVGMVGDTVDVEVDDKDGELYLYTTGTIVAGDGVVAYEQAGQLSVGYVPRCEWRRGIHNGTSYDAVLLDFKDVNHLLICQEARGGPQCIIMDSLESLSPLERFIMQHGGTKMGIFDKIFGKKTPTAGDTLVPILLQSIAVGADPTTQVAAIKAITDKMKIAGDAKTTWDGFLEELAAGKDEDLATKAKAVEIVSQYYNKTIAGDSVGSPEMPDGADGAPDSTTGSPDTAGDNGGAKEGDEAEKAEKPSPGDSAFDVRLTKLESNVDKLVGAVGTLVAQVTAGDAAPQEGNEPGDATASMAGDSRTSTDGKKNTVADFMSGLRS